MVFQVSLDGEQWFGGVLQAAEEQRSFQGADDQLGEFPRVKVGIDLVNGDVDGNDS